MHGASRESGANARRRVEVENKRAIAHVQTLRQPMGDLTVGAVRSTEREIWYIGFISGVSALFSFFLSCYISCYYQKYSALFSFFLSCYISCHYQNITESTCGKSRFVSYIYCNFNPYNSNPDNSKPRQLEAMFTSLQVLCFVILPSIPQSRFVNRFFNKCQTF